MQITIGLFLLTCLILILILDFMLNIHQYYTHLQINSGEGNGNPLQHSCLENPLDREAWQVQSMGQQIVRHDLANEPPLWIDFCLPDTVCNWASCHSHLGRTKSLTIKAFSFGRQDGSFTNHYLKKQHANIREIHGNALRLQAERTQLTTIRKTSWQR